MEQVLKELQKINSRLESLENKINFIQNQTAKLAEGQTEIFNEIKEIKERLNFNAHKLQETEFELFKLKKEKKPV